MGVGELVTRPQHTNHAVAPDKHADPGPAPHRWAGLSVLLIGAFLPPLDFFVVNVALPSIRQGLGGGDSTTQGVMSGYAGAYAVLLVMGGRLGDIYGRRRMFMAGMVGFALTSGLCGLAWSPVALILGRTLQGATAAIMAPQVIASIHVMFPAADKNRALGLYGATFGFSAIIGQMLAGALIGADLFGLGWRMIFLINLPVAAVALTAALPLLRESRAQHARAQRLDIAGAALLCLALTSLIYPLVRGRQEAWPPWAFISMAMCPLLLALFWRVENFLADRGGDPLVHPRLFDAPGFTLGLGTTMLFYTMSAFFLTFSIYLQAGLHKTAFQAGMGILPFGFGFFLGPLTTPAAIRKISGYVPAAGLALTAFGLSMLAGGVNSSGTIHLLLFNPGLFVIGFGQGMVLPTLVRAVIRGVEVNYAGAAAGVVNSTLQVSASLGVATIGGLFFAVISGRMADPATVAHAFTVALLCIAALLFCAVGLAIGLGAQQGRGQKQGPAGR
jgi:MFS family permease